MIYDPVLAPSIDMPAGVETVVSKLHQTILRRQAKVSLENKSPKCSLAFHELYQLASLATMTPPNQHCPFHACEKLKQYSKLFGSATRNVSTYLFRV